jgi:hypothetical protein
MMQITGIIVLMPWKSARARMTLSSTISRVGGIILRFCDGNWPPVENVRRLGKKWNEEMNGGKLVWNINE